jgi:hypothetical protein
MVGFRAWCSWCSHADWRRLGPKVWEMLALDWTSWQHAQRPALATGDGGPFSFREGVLRAGAQLAHVRGRRVECGSQRAGQQERAVRERSHQPGHASDGLPSSSPCCRSRLRRSGAVEFAPTRLRCRPGWSLRGRLLSPGRPCRRRATPAPPSRRHHLARLPRCPP